MRILYGGTIFASSLLLFLVQPMMAKAILPWFGGAAGVWTSALLFFQSVLLLGYLYAYCTTRYLQPRAQKGLHLLLLAASLATLPVVPGVSVSGFASQPWLQILSTLARAVGLPYLVLSSTGPLAQVWFARRAKPAIPYRLFALSNLASLAALLLYPVAIEPMVSTSRQLTGWSVAYAVTALLIGASAIAGTARAEAPATTEVPSSRDRLLWLALAACPSVLFLASANALSQSIAPVPFLWILPLGIYLLTLILSFERDSWYQPAVTRWMLPAAWIAIGYCAAQRGQGLGVKATIAAMSLGLFVCCLFCHGELARRRPSGGHLTSYYLILAAGGALGGLFVGVAAPHLFSSYLELPIGVAGCVILAMGLLYGIRSPGRLARLGIMAAMGFVLAVQVDTWSSRARVRVRNFYGVLQVSDAGSGESAARILSHGAIHHGAQFIAPEKQRLATTYYGPDSGVGRAIRLFGDRPVRVGVVGLGTGTLATYARRGDLYRFYEINPDVVRLAQAEFTFLRDCRGKVETVLGDGRLSLDRDATGPFDVLVLDAFSGDSIPLHLLTREAFALYFRHLRPDGVLACHVTNRYLGLGPVVQRLAQDAGKQAWLVRGDSDPSQYIYESLWVLVGSDGALTQAMAGVASRFPGPQVARAWTDDYSNLWQVLK